MKIHLGENMWMDTKLYNNIVRDAGTNAVFVRDMAAYLYGEDLMNKSVTGMKAPRTGQKKEAIDSTTAMAIHGTDCFHYIYCFLR